MDVIKALFESEIRYLRERIEKTRSNEIHVTDLLQCRMKYILRKTFPEVFEPNPAVTVGRLVHLGLQQLLKEKFGAEVEKTFKREFNGYTIVGTVDAICGDKLIEIKYTKSNGNGLPRNSHVLQSKIYLWLTGLKEARLVYLSPYKLLEYPIKEGASDEEVAKLIKNWTSPKWGEWECRYCLYAKICPYAHYKWRITTRQKNG